MERLVLVFPPALVATVHTGHRCIYQPDPRCRAGLDVGTDVTVGITPRHRQEATLNPTLDVDAVQQALDALITGDREAAGSRFSDDLTLTGTGGCLDGRATGLEAVLHRFADLARLTRGTFGTEVETVFCSASAGLLVVVTRHWALLDQNAVHGVQALLLTVVDGRIRSIDTLSPPGPASGIWD